MGVYDAQWFNTANDPALTDLNALLDQLLMAGTAVLETTPEATVAVTAVASPSPASTDE
jgi:hypothetical protein